MLTPDAASLRAAILSRVPGDGTPIGNIALAKAIAEHRGVAGCSVVMLSPKDILLGATLGDEYRRAKHLGVAFVQAMPWNA